MNMLTLALLDRKSGKLQNFSFTIGYLSTVFVILWHLSMLQHLKLLSTIANTLSVGVGPLLTLYALVKRNSTMTWSQLNHPTLVTAYIKSMIWLAYGYAKVALPMLVSHSFGVVSLTLLYAIALCKKDQATGNKEKPSFDQNRMVDSLASTELASTLSSSVSSDEDVYDE
jgi:hypothetical protein